MSKSSTVFDDRTIRAGLYRLLQNKELLFKYVRLIKPEVIFPLEVNGTGYEINNLAKAILEYHKEKGLDSQHSFTFEGFDSWVRRDVGGEIRENAKRCLHSIQASEEILVKVDDPGAFAEFTNYIKICAFASQMEGFRDNYRSGNADEVVKILNSIVSDMNLATDTPVYHFDVDQEVEKLFLMDELTAGQQKRILPFGNQWIDTALGGGFEPQTLNLFVSYPNGGKSTMAHHLLVQCVKNKMHAHIACVEDRPKSAFSKLLSAYTGIERHVINDPARIQVYRDKIMAAKEEIKKYITMDFVYGRSIDEIHTIKKEHDRQRKEMGQPTATVDIVDYTGHLAGIAKGDAKMFEKMRDAYAKRKNFALEYDKIGFDFAQINREGAQKMNGVNKQGGGKFITLTDLAGSFDLTQVADNIISINRPLDNRASRECNLYVAKARDAQAGLAIQCQVDFTRATFNLDKAVATDGQESIKAQASQYENSLDSVSITA